MLRVQDWLPYNRGALEQRQLEPRDRHAVRRRTARCTWPASRSAAAARTRATTDQTQIVKISFNVQDECLTDTAAPNASHDVTGQAYPGQAEHVRQQGHAQADGNRHRLRRHQVDRVPRAGHDRLAALHGCGHFTHGEEVQRSSTARRTTRTTSPRSRRPRSRSSRSTTTTAPTATAADGGQPGPARLLRRLRHAHADGDRRRDRLRRRQTIEYRVNGGAYTRVHRAGRVQHAGHATTSTTARPTRSTTRRRSRRSRSGSSPARAARSARSDEFDGTTLGSQWQRHTRNGGTPLSALHVRRRRAAHADGRLRARRGQRPRRRVGPVNFIGQDLAALGTNWTAETEFTVKYTGGWQNTGLVIWNGDNNFVRSSITHSLTAGNIYVEQSKDNPTSTEGARSRPAATSRSCPNNDQAVTIRMRYGARQRRPTPSPSQYRVMAPAGIAMADWANFGGIAGNFVDLNPSGGARRDATGSRIGVITAVELPGHEPAPTPTRARRAPCEVNYFRVTPDPVTCETDAPTTTATLDPAAPATGDTYDRSVKVSLVGDRRRHRRRGRREDRVPHHHQRHGRRLDDAEQQRRRQPVRERGHGRQQRHAPRRVPLDGQGGQHGDDEVRHLQGPAAGVRSLGRVRRHGRSCRAGSVTRATAARPPRARSRRRSPAASCTCRRTTSRSTPPTPTTSVGPINFLGQDLPALGNNWTVGDAVHRPVPWRLAERGPGRLERGQQLLPLHAHPQPQPRRSSSSSSKDNPSIDRGRARTRPAATANILADEHRSGHDQDALHGASTAPTRVQAQYQVVAPAAPRQRRLGRLPGRQRRSGPQPERWRAS